jgi:hypothetical protein
VFLLLNVIALDTHTQEPLSHLIVIALLKFEPLLFLKVNALGTCISDITCNAVPLLTPGSLYEKQLAIKGTIHMIENQAKVRLKMAA